MQATVIKAKLYPLTAILLCALVTGCASFEHQTTELEPHALITVVRPWDSSTQPGVLKSLDGLPVSAGKTYRVRPGPHAVVVEFTELVVETAKPATFTLFGNATPETPANVRISETGRASVSGQQSGAGMQSVNLSMEVRRIRAVTNSISVQAGGRYELVGDRLTTKQPAQR